MALTEPKTRKIRNAFNAFITHYNITDSANYFEGAAIGLDTVTGYAVRFGPGTRFIGIACLTIRSQLIPSTNLPLPCEMGQLEVLTVAGATANDIGRHVVATDDGTFIFAVAGIAGVTDDVIGYVVNYLGGSVNNVEILITGPTIDA